MVELSKRDLMPFAIAVSFFFFVVQVLGEREGRPKKVQLALRVRCKDQLRTEVAPGNIGLLTTD